MDLFSPMTPGHETIGDVVAVGPGELVWNIGDRVGAAWHGGHDGLSITYSVVWLALITYRNLPRMQERLVPDVSE
jgi:NADPH:quinone reductase-like Zn-dependent oxidoreductase